MRFHAPEKAEQFKLNHACSESLINQKGADSYTLLFDWSRDVNTNANAIANR